MDTHYTKFLYLLILTHFITSTPQKEPFQWAIIGAGPAGISVVGLLLDAGVPENTITWVDPKFTVGRLGEHYAHVPGNTRACYFVEFIKCCKTFQNVQSKSLATLFAADPDKEYTLQIIVDPLQDITDYLRTHVTSIQASLQSLDFDNNLWHIGAHDQIIAAHNVVLATGSHPRTPDYSAHTSSDTTIIPLDVALDKSLLAQETQPQDAIAVVGSAHSAILILKHLSEIPVKRIINFYNKPLQYAIPNPNGIMYETENGLKGETARWAQEVLEKKMPANMIRIFNTPEALQAWLTVCNKIIYALGFERNELPPLNGDSTLYNAYDSSSGIIAPHLFGIGIAFPETVYDCHGTPFPGIGVNDFIEYAQRVLPLWMQKRCSTELLLLFKNLFTITPL